MTRAKRERKSIYALYDTRDNLLPVIIGDVEDIARYAEMTIGSIRSAICRPNQLVRHRYELERIE